MENNIVMENKIVNPIRKNEQAKELIKNSAKLISQADSEVEATKESIAKDVSRFEEIKNSLLSTTIIQGQILLEKASFVYIKPESDEPFEISLGNTNDNIKVNNISGGGFTAFILAIFAMLATAVAWIFVASTKVGVIIEPPAIPDNASIDKIMSWIGGGMTGGDGNPLFGMITIGLTALIIGVIVYKFYVSIKENKNFKVANNTFEKSQLYVDRQKESKTEMEKIDEHIKKVVSLLEDYRVLLDEQNAKLQRIIHVEGELEDNSQYHQSSLQEMQESERLMEKAEELMIIPITKNGKINENSINSLNEAITVYDYYLSKIYS
ncbi:MAG TPA: hypothetical protein ENK88_00005 [Campylobacterales bacterium]|nr:hypothetical protein [Campylobacterales bacterium]HHH51369.1 hypothetical protein [Campylobacterales bacterium]